MWGTYGPQRDPVEPRPRAARAAGNLLVDAVSIEILSTLEGADLEAVLLKGPSIATWLYEVGERIYTDTDLLVAPSETEKAIACLMEMSFSAPAQQLPGNRPWIAIELRRADGAAVDLHRSIPGIGVDDHRAWSVLSGATDSLDLRGTTVAVLNEVARTMHVALHAANHGPDSGVPMRDLRRAIEVVPEPTWLRAAELAAALDASAAFATGLQLVPEGENLARRLGVAGLSSVEARLTSASLSELELSFGLGFDWLATRSGPSSKARYILAKLFPPPSWIRAWWPKAPRGPAGLALAYVRRWAWLGLHAYPGYRAWRRAKKRATEPRVTKTG